MTNQQSATYLIKFLEKIVNTLLSHLRKPHKTKQNRKETWPLGFFLQHFFSTVSCHQQEHAARINAVGTSTKPRLIKT